MEAGPDYRTLAGRMTDRSMDAAVPRTGATVVMMVVVVEEEEEEEEEDSGDLGRIVAAVGGT